MRGTKRDDFSEKTKRALAYRAGHQCSFQGCSCPTSGPSDESDEAVISIGIAAHIHAASPGGKRYLASMTPEERKDINNGIWLCANHSIEIDRDEKSYSADLLREMKASRERAASKNLSLNASNSNCYELFEIGPDVIISGGLVKAAKADWKIKIEHFVIGGIPSLIKFIDSFDDLDPYSRYVISNEIGDGRSLIRPPEWEKIEDKYYVTCFIDTSFPRKPAHKLGADFALNDDHDIFLENGNLAMVSGVKALPQKIKTCLSMIQGESLFHPNYGSRLNQFYKDYKGTPWLSSLFKLDVIRLASIPYSDSFSSNESYLPLSCVNHVDAIQIIESERKDKWVPIDFHLEIEGLGKWNKRISIFVPPYEESN